MGPLLSTLRRDESGFGLIEVVVSAMLLTLVAAGVYRGLDAASATSGVNKARSQAAQVAQNDQDRMRAMTVNELSNYRETQTTTIGAITYTVNSSASWITDDTGAASCTGASAQAHYLRIATSVTWPNMRIRPVTIESVMAPPAGSFGTNLGSIAVQVNDGAGTGEQGVVVTLTGPKGYTDVTNENGCVLWGYLPTGSYNVSISRAGYTDPAGATTPTNPVTVTGGTTTTTAFIYDVVGRIQVAYETLTQANGTVTAVRTPNPSFMLESSHFSTPVGPTVGGVSGNLFPWGDAYGVYAGACEGADPQDYAGARASAVTALVRPGALTSATVRMPPIDLRVMNGTSTPFNDASVVLTGTARGCAALPLRRTGSDGYLLDRAFPYGNYNICASGTIGGTTYKKTGTVVNGAPTGVANSTAITFNLASSTGRLTGSCP